MKKLLLDSANIDDIRTFCASSAIAGVTTNPSLVAKEPKGDYTKALRKILEVMEYGHLSVEVTTLDPEEMFKQAMSLNKSLGDGSSDEDECWREDGIDLFVKIPVMVETLPIISQLSAHGVRVNATACMTATQAFLAAEAGAEIVSFFYNRMIDGIKGNNPDDPHPRQTALTEISNFKKLIQDDLDTGKICAVICGSIRRPPDVAECLLAGADAVTVPPAILREIIGHPQTTRAISQFQKDIDAWLR